MDKLTLADKTKIKFKRNKSADKRRTADKRMSKKRSFITNIMTRHGLDCHELMGFVSFKAGIFHAYT